MIQWMAAGESFPDPSTALDASSDAPGLLAASANMNPKRLFEAYCQGIFPWYSEGQPVLWWSTDPRMVLPVSEFVVSRSLKKKLRMVDKSMKSDGAWQVRFDSAFEDVMLACAAPRGQEDGTWITPEIIQHYCQLHKEGFAHSAELWRDDELVGGAYGICIGTQFFGESMFSRVADGSKIALAWLVHFLKKNNVLMIDCQQETAHLASLGARAIPRAEFLTHLRQAIAQKPIKKWQPMSPFE